MRRREAALDDMPALLVWARAFHAASGVPAGFDEGAVAGFLAGMMASPNAVVLTNGHGGIGGALVPAYTDPSHVMAVELFWWAERGGMGLLAAFEGWAKDMGAAEVRMTTLSNLPRADALLRRKGFRPMEISYTRAI